MKKLPFVVLILVISGIGSLLYIRTTTPQYSLGQIRYSISDRDTEKFSEFVDTESLVTRLVDDVLLQSMKEMDPESNAEGLGAALGMGIAQMLKPRLVDELQKSLLRFVEDGGAIEGSKKDSEKVSVPSIFQKIGFKQNFSGVNYIKTTGKISQIGLGYRSDEFNTDFVLELKMVKIGSKWKLKELSNFLEIANKIEQLKAQFLLEISHEIQSEIDDCLKISADLNLFNKDRWDEWLRISAFCKKNTERTIEKVSMHMTIKNTDGDIIFEQGLLIDEFGGEGPYIWEIDLNQFSDKELIESLRQGSEYMYDNMVAKLQIKELDFNGKDLKVPETYEEAIFLQRLRDLGDYYILPSQEPTESQK